MISPELKDKVLQVIDSSVTIKEFEDWLTLNIHKYLTSPVSPDADIVAAIELGFAEMSDGIRTENGFRQLLQQALFEQITISIPPSDEEFSIRTSSSDKTVEMPIVFTVRLEPSRS